MAHEEDLICPHCGRQMESEADFEKDFCIICLSEPDEEEPEPEDDEDNPSTMEDPDEAKLDYILKLSEQ